MPTTPRHQLSDSQFQRIAHLLPLEKDRDGAPAKFTNRAVLHGALWVEKTGAPWRDLPKEMGPWNAIYKRYRSWCRLGIWPRLLTHLSIDCDDEWNSLDSSIIKVHQDASGGAGGQKKTPSAQAEAVKPRK